MKSARSKRRPAGRPASRLAALAGSMGGPLSRFAPIIKYFAVAVWVYRVLKRRSAPRTAKVVVKAGEAIEISTKARR